MSEPNIVTLLISALCGGLAGGFLTSRIAAKRYKVEASLKYINDIVERVEEIEEVYRIIHNKLYRIIDRGHDGLVVRTFKKEEYDKVVIVGDRFNLIMYLYLRHKLNNELIDKSIKKFIMWFIDSLIQNDQDKFDKFYGSVYDPSKCVYNNIEWQEAWPDLSDYIKNKKYRWEYFKTLIFG